MRILFLGKLSDKTLSAIKELGDSISVTADDSLDLRTGYDVLITDSKRAGLLPQPFEQLFRASVLLSAPDRSELRIHSQLEPGKYRTNIERFICEKAPSTVVSFKDNFLLGFVRSLYADENDIRRAMKSGNKFGIHGVFDPN